MDFKSLLLFSLFVTLQCFGALMENTPEKEEEGNRNSKRMNHLSSGAYLG